ncbi:hypothetical protein B0H16DRAFT_1303488 [Mycena metata]|uniref:Voltage-gated hydrogen channel 1 n=1 Tax=Mycena metata TaxID=1033252 RepID=A0AAD7K2W0_9AGAR|nr:hypothetical protein B0H16DRAFT_1303488 [Mycena metata]
MSEQTPLLPSVSQPAHRVSRRERAAEFLESSLLHKLVILLVCLAAFACVLADLGYAFLDEGCAPPEGPDAPVWLSVLSHISLGITAFFLLEIPCTLWALGPRFYNPWGRVPHAALHLFDAFIIITTFVLEVILKGKEQELAGLLIILRLWRLVKLVGGVSVGVGELGEEDAVRAADAESEVEALKKENADLRARTRGCRCTLTKSDPPQFPSRTISLWTFLP